MSTNVGRADRIARFILGGVVLGLYGALDAPWKYLTLLGLIPLGTSLTGFCPFYAAIGWNRRRTSTGGAP
jgi:DUF2892 family protein